VGFGGTGRGMDTGKDRRKDVHKRDRLAGTIHVGGHVRPNAFAALRFDSTSTVSVT